MDSASVSELKARLSHYLRKVRSGGEVQVLDRGVPVARLVAVESVGPEARQLLASSGSVRAAERVSDEGLQLDPVKIDVDLLAALHEEREDRV
jgi:prevent-host-death family protein